MAKEVWGYSSEDAFKRAASAIRKIEGSPTNQRTQRRVPPVLTGGDPLQPFLVVETPYFTSTITGHIHTVYCVLMPRPGLPLGLNRTLTPTPHVTVRDGTSGLPTKAFLQHVATDPEPDNEEFDCVPVNVGHMCGRPLRGQIIFATQVRGEWYATGTINPTLFASAVSSGEVRAEIRAAGFEDDENAQILLGSTLPFHLPSLVVNEGDIVVITWVNRVVPVADYTDSTLSSGLGDYYITYVPCQDTEE